MRLPALRRAAVTLTLFISFVATSATAHEPADEVMIVTAEANPPSHRVSFMTVAPLADRKVTVVQIGGTYIRTVASDAIGQPGEYDATLPAYPEATSLGWDDVAVITPAREKARVVKLGPREHAAVSALRDEAFERVTHVFERAVSFAGGRPDIAFLEVCVEYPTDDAMCAATTVYAARRLKAGTWKLVACGMKGTCTLGFAGPHAPAEP